MTTTDLAMIAGAILTLVFSYLPGLNKKFDALQPEQKRLIMLAMIVLVALGIYGLSCAGYGERLGYSIQCGETGLLELIKLIISAAIANQGVYKLTKR